MKFDEYLVEHLCRRWKLCQKKKVYKIQSSKRGKTPAVCELVYKPEARVEWIRIIYKIARSEDLYFGVQF